MNKKIITIMSAFALLLNMSPVGADIAKAAVIDNTEIIAPNNIAIDDVTNSLSLISSRKLNCYGKTKVSSGYIANVVVELQQKNGGWTTIKTWNASNTSSASVDEDYSVAGGYYYRLKLTHRAYNANGVVETITKYSNEVYVA